MKKLLFVLLVPLLSFSQTPFQKGQAFFENKDYEQAEKALVQVSPSDSNYEKSTAYLGEIKCYKKDWEAALPYFRKLKNMDSQSADYQYKYGGVLGMIAKESNCFRALSLVGDMKVAFEKAIALDPKHIDARWALVELYLQLPGIAGGSEKKARIYAGQLYKLSPVDGFLAYGKISEYFKNYKDAEKYYAAAIDTGNSRKCYEKLADLYENKMNQPQKARQLMAEFNRKNKS